MTGTDDVSTLARARLYVVAPHRIPAGELADVVPDLAAAGVDVLQLREKEMEANDVIHVADPIRAACAGAGVAFVINDRPDIALELGCGVHLGQNDLPVRVARKIVGDAVVGISTHSEDEIERAVSSPHRLDYVVVGPVFETPTKPGRPATGVELLTHAAGVVDRPWFAVGGINPGNLRYVLDAGARRIVVVRAVTEARDPVAAAARLKQLLDEAPL